MKHQHAAGGRRVDRFGERPETDIPAVHQLDRFSQLLHRPGQTVELPHNQGIAVAHIVECRGQLRPVALRAGGFLLEDAPTASHLQRIKLKRRRLILR
jgi:hypothetical protein